MSDMSATRYVVVCEKCGNRPLAYIDDDRPSGEWVRISSVPQASGQLVFDDPEEPDRAKWSLPEYVVSEVVSTTGRMTYTIRCDSCQKSQPQADLSQEMLNAFVDSANPDVLETLSLEDPDDVDEVLFSTDPDAMTGLDSFAVWTRAYRARRVVPLGVLCLWLTRFSR
jgi:hypothetical protein